MAMASFIAASAMRVSMLFDVFAVFIPKLIPYGIALHNWSVDR